MSNSSVPLLSAHSITKSFGPRTARHQVLFDVSADVHAGECLAVIGGSGLRQIHADPHYAGLGIRGLRQRGIREPIHVGGRKSPGFAALRRESGLVFQDPFSSLDPRWRVAKSVAEPLSLQRRDLNNTDIDERVAAALTMAGLEPADFLNRYPIDLSGGQAQRVVIARAIINEPKVILADEPMSAIDVAARIQILDTFAAIRAARPSTAIIMVSHDLGVVQHIADRILVLHDGRLEETGSTAEVLGNPQSDYTRSAHRGSLVIDLFLAPSLRGAVERSEAEGSYGCRRIPLSPLRGQLPSGRGAEAAGDTRLSRVVLWCETCRLSHVVVANRRPWASGQ